MNNKTVLITRYNIGVCVLAETDIAPHVYVYGPSNPKVMRMYFDDIAQAKQAYDAIQDLITGDRDRQSVTVYNVREVRMVYDPI